MTQSRHALPPGYVLMDYKLERILGAGGFGITYLAYDGSLKRYFAIKEYFPFDLTGREGTVVTPFSDTAEEYERGLNDFIGEAQTLARFHHPNIVNVARIFEANNTAYMVLNYEQGESFKEQLRNRQERLGQEEIDAIAAPLLDALQLVHKDSTLHRDIAPDNIYIRRDGSPVLLDFGAARQALHSRSRSVSAIVKPGYSPQEQYSSQTGRQGPWTDIYALSATLYRAVSGFVPQDASDRVIEDSYEPLSGMNLRGFRPTFLAAIDWALSLPAKDRPQSVAEWRPALLDGKPLPQKSAATSVPALSKPKTPRWKVGVLAGVVLAVLSASAGGTAYYFTQRIGRLNAATEQQLADLNQQIKSALQVSDQTRNEIDRVRREADAEVAARLQSREESTTRSRALEEKLLQAESEARNASSSERAQFEQQAARLADQLKSEQARAKALNEAEGSAREALQRRISELEGRLRLEESETAKALKQTFALRGQGASKGVQFAGLELTRENNKNHYRVAGVASDSAFLSRLSVNDVVSSISINGNPVTIPDDPAAAKPILAACDALSAEMIAPEGTRVVQAFIPQDYAAVASSAPTRIDSQGFAVATPGSGRGFAIIVSVAPGSPAAEAGLLAGDRILAVDDDSEGTVSSFSNAIDRYDEDGGDISLEVLRDCETQVVRFESPVPVVTEMLLGMSVSLRGDDPITIASIPSGSLFSSSELQVGDELLQVTGQGWSYMLRGRSEISRVNDFATCGDVRVSYSRGGRQSEFVSNLEVASDGQRVSWPVLGLTLLETRDRQRLVVTGFQTADIDLQTAGLRVGDIIRSVGSGAGRLVSLSAGEQEAFVEGGGPINLDRDCRPLRIDVLPNPLETEVREFATFQNYDLTGAVFDRLNLSDAADCKIACGETEMCQAYTFDAWNGICFLKEDYGQLKVNARSTSGVASGNSRPAYSTAPVEFEYFNGKGFPGSGYAEVRSANRDACQESCSDRRECIAFNFIASRQQCQLFRTAGEYTSRAGVRSGAKRQE